MLRGFTRLIAYTFKKVITKEDGTIVQQKLLLLLNAYEDYNIMIERHQELKGAQSVGLYYPDFNDDEVPLDVVLSSESDSKKYYIAALAENKKLLLQTEELIKLGKESKLIDLIDGYRLNNDETNYNCLARVLEEYSTYKIGNPLPEIN